VSKVDNGYIPLTDIFKIAGSSYGLQLGKQKDGDLVLAIYKENKIIEFARFKDKKYIDEISIKEIALGIVRILVPIPINPYQAMQTCKALLISLKK